MGSSYAGGPEAFLFQPLSSSATTPGSVHITTSKKKSLQCTSWGPQNLLATMRVPTHAHSSPCPPGPFQLPLARYMPAESDLHRAKRDPRYCIPAHESLYFQLCCQEILKCTAYKRVEYYSIASLITVTEKHVTFLIILLGFFH